MKLAPQNKIKNNITLPGDKSISHRCLILSSLAAGESRLYNISTSEDVSATIKVLKNLGITIKQVGNETLVQGQGLFFPKASSQNLDCGNAGTLMRLMMGVLAGQNFKTVLVGDDSLHQRPMDRVAEPLKNLGAKIQLNGKTAPVEITPSKLAGGNVELTIASAQIKSALLLAGFYTEQPLTLTGALDSRDHTERLLPMYGCELSSTEKSITIFPKPQLKSVTYSIPCDPSAAAFWLGASLLSGQNITLKNVSLNPSRMGFLNVFENLGAKIEIQNKTGLFEVSGDITFYPSAYSGFEITKEKIPSLIDEIPLLCLLASQAESDSVIYGVEELRHKETDRIYATEKLFESLGLKIVYDNGLIIPGRQKIRGGIVNSFKDHRIAMTAAIASFKSEGEIEILNSECASISDPFFWRNFI